MCGIAWAKTAIPGKTRAAVIGISTFLVAALSSLGVFAITEYTVAEVSAGSHLIQAKLGYVMRVVWWILQANNRGWLYPCWLVAGRAMQLSTGQRLSAQCPRSGLCG